MSKPWDRLEEETDGAFRAFVAYRDLGGSRSIQAATTALGLSGGGRHLEEWSSAHAWVARARAWDAHLEEARRAAMVEEVVDMGRRQAAQAMAFADVFSCVVEELRGRVARGELGDLALDELVGILRSTGPVWASAVKLERLARGEATDRVERSTPALEGLLEELEDLDAAELAQRYRGLLR